MRRTRRSIAENEINVTPLLDVVFIMLIFFLVTASFIKESAIDLNPPSGGSSALQGASGNIIVAIGPNDRLWVNHLPISLGSLQPRLSQLHAENTEGKVIVMAHPQSSNGLLVQVIDFSRLSGVRDVQLADTR